MSKPSVFLLCGLPGSGKTTYANLLVNRTNIIKVSIDEIMLEKYGVVGKDYPEDKYKDNKTEVMSEIKQLIVKKVVAKESLVLDFGVWKKRDRDYFKNLIEGNGGECRLIYFKAGRDVLVRRLINRHEIEAGKAFRITEPMLDERIAEFEEPTDENEETIEQV